MIKGANRIGSLLLMATLILCLGGCSLFKSKLTVGVSPNYYPYEYLTKSHNLTGFDIDLAKALGETLNQTIQFKTMGFQDLIPSLERGEIDLIISGLSITEARSQEINLIPYQDIATKHLVLASWGKPHQKITSLEHFLFLKKQIAVQAGSFQDNYIESLEGLDILPIESNLDLIKALQEKRVTAALFEPVIVGFMKKLFPKLHLVNIDLPDAFHATGFGIGVSYNNPTLAKQVQTAIAQLKKDGTLQKLEKAWFENTPPPSLH